MGSAVSEDSFFSRWSRRKALVREGLKPDQAPATTAGGPALAAPVARSHPAGQPDPGTKTPPGPATDAGLPVAETSAAAEHAPPPPTMDDVEQLTSQSDFSRFVARQVPSEVRNAAVKKLFADPRFNVMDGLDVYIDDYSQPSPLSAAQMAKMVGAQFLKLVDDPSAARTEEPASPPDQTQAATTAAAEEQQKPPTDPPVRPARPEETSHDDHADLQLQPDDAPEPQGPGGRTG
jgi:hypothetical protein